MAEIASNESDYTIPMGGKVDMDHAMTREYGMRRFGWQPNESIVIENIGAASLFRFFEITVLE